jgi:hypothetical protein
LVTAQAGARELGGYCPEHHLHAVGERSASDIAILDRQAAIEFRTYYSGTTVIKATSSGLSNSTVTITSQGDPIWVEGTSPKVENRPYKP